MSKSVSERALTETLGKPLPGDFNKLKSAELDDLAVHVKAALEHHQSAIEDAEENILKLVPRPTRGTVRRMLRSGR